MTGVHSGKQANSRKIMCAAMIRRLFGDKSPCYISQFAHMQTFTYLPCHPRTIRYLRGW